MYMLTYSGAVAISALLSICALTLIALGSRRARHYAHRHPIRYAALGVILAVSNVMAQKTPATPPPGFYMRMLVQPGTNTSGRTMRPVDFGIEVQ